MVSRRGLLRASTWSRPVASVVIAGLAVVNGSMAEAQPANPNNDQIAQAEANANDAASYLQSLVAVVSEHQRQVAGLELEIGSLQEYVNRSMVDLEKARANADQTRAAVDTARKQLTDAQEELRAAQQKFDRIARSIMRQGYSSGSAFEGAKSVSDALNRQAQIRREADRQKAVVDKLDKSRTESANKEASLRTAKDDAETAEAEAQQRSDEADAAYADASQKLSTEQAAYEQASVERDAAQAALDAARKAVKDLHSQRKDYESEEAKKEAEQKAAEQAAEQAAAKSRAEAKSDSSDKSADSNSSDTANSAGAHNSGTSSSGNSNSSAADSTSGSAGSGNTGSGGTSGSNNSASGNSDASNSGSASTESSTAAGESTESDSTAGTPLQTATPKNPETGQVSSSASSSAKVEAVISRAMSQLGVPYTWGGGNANGPTKGIRGNAVGDANGDYNKIGFDCSGLTLYAYAAIGIELPHYTGYQYQRGTHYPVSQMKRGDLLFWGENASSHVAIYLGDGQMIEAPHSGSVVKISPVRYNGMMPNVVRLV